MRHQGYIEHKLSDVLIIVMCAVLCGLDELGDILLFAQSRLKLLNERFGIEKIPSKMFLKLIVRLKRMAVVLKNAFAVRLRIYPGWIVAKIGLVCVLFLRYAELQKAKKVKARRLVIIFPVWTNQQKGY